MPGLTPRSTRKVARTVNAVSRAKRNLIGTRRQTYPTGGSKPAPPGECTCKEVHRFVTNGPTAGTFSVDYTINGVTETVTWDWDAPAADVETAMETHSEVASGDVEVTGGPWPFVGLYVEFAADLAGVAIDFPVVDNSGLTGGSGFMDRFSKGA